MTGKLLAAWAWYAGLWLVLGAVGLFVGFGYALVGAAAAALLPVVSLVGAVCARRSLALSLSFPAYAAKGQTLRGHVELIDPAVWPAPRVLCRVRARNELTGVETKHIVTASAAAHGRASGTICLRSVYCGSVCVRIERAWVTDMLGLIPVPLSTKAQARLTVLPDSFAAQAYVPPLAPEDTDRENYRPDRPGPDVSEPFQLRPYRLGDDVRRIHWKLSSKLDETVVRDGSEPVARRLLLFWDKTAMPSGAAMDTLAEALVSVARAVTESGLGCTLGWTGPDGAVFEPVDDVDSLLNAMPALLRAGGGAAETPLFADYGYTLYFTASEPKELSPRVKLLLYSRTPREGALCFDETNCADVLRRLELI